MTPRSGSPFSFASAVVALFQNEDENQGSESRAGVERTNGWRTVAGGVHGKPAARECSTWKRRRAGSVAHEVFSSGASQATQGARQTLYVDFCQRPATQVAELATALTHERDYGCVQRNWGPRQ